MTLEGVPWFVDGADHGPEIARVLAYAAMGGGEGVIGSSDFKVTASAIPNGNIHIAPGALAALNRFAGGSGQGYLVRNVGDEVKAMTPQGSGGGRYDLVAIIVEDPQYAGQPAPASVPDGPYVRVAVYQNVPSTTKHLYEVDADQTGYAVALVHFNASDGTVTDSEITDLRQKLISRRKEEVFTANGTGTTNLGAGLVATPPEAAHNITIPEWATKVILEGYWSETVFADTSTGNGYATASCRVALGTLVTDEVVMRADATGANKAITKTYFSAGTLDVPDALRGTVQSLQGQQKYLAKVTMNVYTDTYSSVVLKATFIEDVE